MTKIAAVLLAALSTATLTPAGGAVEPAVAHGMGLATKKGPDRDDDEAPPLLATLVQVHSHEHAPLDARTPAQARFSDLLSDRATGDRKDLDPALLGLLRDVAGKHPGATIELVSGYRSWKLNEMLRKKGHHVASHSQHSLGHACDFRVLPPGEAVGVSPMVLEGEIRALGWEGGVGVYPTAGDWFVHADVGKNRRWVN